MIISTQDLQINWLERNRAELKRIMAENGVIVQPNETLADALARVYQLPPLTQSPAEGTAPEFHELSSRRLQLQRTNPLRAELKAVWDKVPEPAEIPETDDPMAPLLPKPEETDNDYLRGFAYLGQKRRLAQQKGLRWLLEEQRQLLLRLKNQAWYGKISALGYGLAIGLSLAGFLALLVGLGTWWVMPIIGLVSWFPMQQNFWISRRAPSELIFDLFSSPRESTPDYSWGRELLARLLGLCNALIYGGLIAYGMWEFFTIAAWTASPLGMLICKAATFILGMMVFLPELGLGIKFNREQLKANPIKKLLASILIDANGRLLKPNLALITTLSYGELFERASAKHLWRFTWVFACTLIGTVFTALAAADMASSLLGIPFGAGCALLSIMAMSLMPFYLDKALKNAVKLHESDYVKQNTVETSEQKPQAEKNLEPGLSHSPGEKYQVFTRWVNAAMNSVPAFIGGVGLLTGFGGMVIGVLTAFAGGVASFLSGEDGREVGYEDIIDAELTQTNQAYRQLTCKEIPGPPTVEVDGARQEATRHPLMFRPFHTTAETQERELHLLCGTLPDSAWKKMKSA